MMIELKSCQLSRKALKLNSWAYFFTALANSHWKSKLKLLHRVLLRDPLRDCQTSLELTFRAMVSSQ